MKLNYEEITEALEEKSYYEFGNLQIEVLKRDLNNNFYSNKEILMWRMNISDRIIGSYIALSEKSEIIKNDPILVFTLENVERQIKDKLLSLFTKEYVEEKEESLNYDYRLGK